MREAAAARPFPSPSNARPPRAPAPARPRPGLAQPLQAGPTALGARAGAAAWGARSATGTPERTARPPPQVRVGLPGALGAAAPGEGPWTEGLAAPEGPALRRAPGGRGRRALGRRGPGRTGRGPRAPGLTGPGRGSRPEETSRRRASTQAAEGTGCARRARGRAAVRTGDARPCAPRGRDGPLGARLPGGLREPGSPSPGESGQGPRAVPGVLRGRARDPVRVRPAATESASSTQTVTTEGSW